MAISLANPPRSGDSFAIVLPTSRLFVRQNAPSPRKNTKPCKRACSNACWPSGHRAFRVCRDKERGVCVSKSLHLCHGASKNMKRLIVNADDLAADEARNAGIFEAIAQGRVTSVSLLPNGPAVRTHCIASVHWVGGGFPSESTSIFRKEGLCLRPSPPDGPGYVLPG